MKGIWLSQAEITALPMNTPAWNTLLKAAKSTPGKPSISNQDSDTNVLYLAKALVYARTGNTDYLTPVIDAITAIATEPLESGSRALALGRELPAFVIAADLIDLETKNPSLHETFKSKLRFLLHVFTTSGGPSTLAECSEVRPNNWGAHAIAARMAIDLYIGDTADLNITSKILAGYLGDRSAWSKFKFGDLSWQSDKTKPVSINPVGAMIQGHDVDGAQPEELRRAGGFEWPPPTNNGYPWEALQGLTVAATMAERAGFLAFDWSDQALMRAVHWLYNNNWPATGDDKWNVYLFNYAYNLDLPVDPNATPGKNMGWTQWTHAQFGSVPEPTFFKFIISVTTGGTVNQVPTGTSFKADTVVSLLAVPDEGFHFVGWSGAVSGSVNPTTVTMNKDQTVKATFAADDVPPDDELAQLKLKVSAALEAMISLQISITNTRLAVGNLETDVDNLFEELGTIITELS